MKVNYYTENQCWRLALQGGVNYHVFKVYCTKGWQEGLVHSVDFGMSDVDDQLFSQNFYSSLAFSV